MNALTHVAASTGGNQELIEPGPRTVALVKLRNSTMEGQIVSLHFGAFQSGVVWCADPP